MKVFCAFILLFCVAFLGINAACPPAGFQGCTCNNLKVKCENDEKITDIPPWIPNNTTDLEFVGCKIRFLNGNSFKNLVNLTVIKIKSQREKRVFNDSSVFQGLNRLSTVDFEDSRIESFPDLLFANLPRLKLLGLSDNKFSKFPDNLLKNSSNVYTLRIANTYLGKDDIAKIGKGHFGKNIAELFMSGTYIQRLGDNFFGGLPELKHLGITNCGIEFIAKDVLKGTKVEIITLNDNPINRIDENAFRDSKAVAFECKSCQLTSKIAFSGFLNKMGLISRINLQNNNLTQIPKTAFTGLTRLSIIDLSNNNISTIEENPYANLPECDNADTCIQLHDNPLRCDCHLAWFRSFSDSIKGDKTGWKCDGFHDGKILVSLKVDEFCCQSSNGTKCGPSNPNTGWIVTSHVMLAMVSQILVLFGIPLLLA